MIHYILTNQDGEVVRRGACSIESEIPEIPGLRTEVVGADDDRRPQPPKPTVSEARAIEYPSIGDQLGAIWKAIAPLINHPEADAILARIQAVKDSNPKT